MCHFILFHKIVAVTNLFDIIAVGQTEPHGDHLELSEKTSRSEGRSEGPGR